MIVSQRKLDTRASSPYIGVSTRRRQFDTHVDTCIVCEHHLCTDAENLWRLIILAAARAYGESR